MRKVFLNYLNINITEFLLIKSGNRNWLGREVIGCKYNGFPATWPKQNG